jgi:hypothetical protein
MGFSNRTFGVELEVAGIDEYEAEDALTKIGITKWSFKEDGSISCNKGKGVEVVSPILCGKAGLKQVEKVCKALTDAGAVVNSSCGLHVHVGAADLSGAQVLAIVKRYSKWENKIDSLITPDRRSNRNGYCQSLFNVSARLIDPVDVIKTHMIDTIESYKRYMARHEHNVATCQHVDRWSGRLALPANCENCRYHSQSVQHYERLLGELNESVALLAGGQLTQDHMCQIFFEDRYYKVNVQSLRRHSTIEFRHHHGSVDSVEVCNWVKFVLSFVERSLVIETKAKEKRQGRRDCSFMSGLDPASKNYFAQKLMSASL